MPVPGQSATGMQILSGELCAWQGLDKAAVGEGRAEKAYEKATPRTD